MKIEQIKQIISRSFKSVTKQGGLCYIADQGVAEVKGDVDVREILYAISLQIL